jgi:hypothetical protein
MSKPIIETVREIYSTGAQEYRGILFEHYIVYLENHEDPYKMSKKYVKDVDFIPRVGDKITCTFEDGRMKQVKLLMEYNPK